MVVNEVRGMHSRDKGRTRSVDCSGVYLADGQPLSNTYVPSNGKVYVQQIRVCVPCLRGGGAQTMV